MGSTVLTKGSKIASPVAVETGYIVPNSSLHRSLVGGPLLFCGSDVSLYSECIDSLEGSPLVIVGAGPVGSWGGEFDLAEIQITSLLGGPLFVNGDYNCSETDITSLEGVAVYIGGDLNLMDTSLDTPNNAEEEKLFFSSFPRYIGGSLRINGNALAYIRRIPDFTKYMWNSYRKYIGQGVVCGYKGDDEDGIFD